MISQDKQLNLETKVVPTEFDIDTSKLDGLNDGGVNILIPLPTTQNVYVLSILATLSRVLSELVEKHEVKIYFLLLERISKNMDYIKNPIKKHNEHICKDIFALWGLHSNEFKSLINMTLLNFTDKKRIRKIVLSGVTYTDIDDYIRNNNISACDGKVEDKLNTPKKNTTELTNTQVFLFSKFGDGDRLSTQLVRIINHFNNTDKNMVIIFSESVEKELTGTGTLTVNSNVVVSRYPDPIDPNILREIKGVPTFLTILSKYYNDMEPLQYFKYCVNEYHYSALFDLFNCRLFESDLDIHKVHGDAATYNGGRVFIRGNNDLQTFKIQFMKPQQEVIKTINDGFLTLQNELASQLDLIL